MRICLRPEGEKLSEWIGNPTSGISPIGREKQKQFLAYSIQTLRKSLMLGKLAISIDADEEDFLRKFSPYVPFENAAIIADELNKAYHAIERNAYPKILFMSLSLRIHELLAVPKKAMA
ncbi:MAG: hypothetical protein ACLQQ4_10630 [Bacteroidia bacterium]